MKAVTISNLTKIYNTKAKTVTALKNINVEFEFGKFYLITGHSGSGKSTLLRIIGLIDNATSGDIFLNGTNIKELKSKQLADIRNKEIGFIFQEFFLDKFLTARENVTIPMLINKSFSAQEAKIRSNELLAAMGLSARANHFPKELSGGEQQRVAIARSLANNPNIILADEPTGNLDIENEIFIFEKLKEMSNNGKCIIMVSHSKDALKYADKVLEIENGELKC